MTQSKRLGVGVIGCGTIAYWTHLRQLRSLRARVVAAADPDPAARRRAGRWVRGEVTADAGPVLADPAVDAVVIATPNALHARLAVDAIEAGKHVYLEKPIAIGADEAERLRAAAAATPKIVRIGFNRRCHPVFERGRDLVADGRLGRVHAIQAVFTEPLAGDQLPAWKRRRESGGGALLDLASHHIDLLRWILGDEVERVEAELLSEEGEHDAAHLRLDFADGARMTGFYSFRAARADTITLVGEQGVLSLDRHRTTGSLRVERRLGYGVREAWGAPSWASWRWRLARLARPSIESSYRSALARFLAACAGQADGLATVEDGWRSLEVVLAAERSAAENRAVALAG